MVSSELWFESNNFNKYVRNQYLRYQNKLDTARSQLNPDFFDNTTNKSRRRNLKDLGDGGVYKTQNSEI